MGLGQTRPRSCPLTAVVLDTWAARSERPLRRERWAEPVPPELDAMAGRCGPLLRREREVTRRVRSREVRGDLWSGHPGVLPRRGDGRRPARLRVGLAARAPRVPGGHPGAAGSRRGAPAG